MPAEPSRILIVDDNESIHHDFRQILDRSKRASATASLDDLERLLGGAPVISATPTTYELTFASQGEDAVREVARGREGGAPFGVAFVDVRMPPGIDGIETIRRIWQIQPELEIVICSAYSDHSWEDIDHQLSPGDRLVILRKPFDAIEVRQLAACLSEKWQRGRQLDDKLRNLEAQVQAEVEARLRERGRHEEEQRRSRRLQALGQLAAGLAHEINTPTQFASSSLEYLAEVVPMLGAAVEEQSACLAGVARGELTIAEACLRAGQHDLGDAVTEAPRAIVDARTGLARISRIVQSVRSHAHLRDGECLVPIDVNDQVRAALELARNEYKYDADAVADLGDVPLVLGDAGDLCLAILNLIVNAAHAIRDKRAADGNRGTIRITTGCSGDRVEIAVGDSGAGIPAAIRDRIFDPFFTTKPVGQGTGQGLSIARATIVDRHRGTLRFESEPGAGTVFVITLPAHVRAGAA
ncbi:MAG TPA: ATP-binding protein [Kofleriaceae bacterium]|jgi:signal transduction histidine kinase|nr:ATP-binding protein [Kofleriaceae bacterium]